MNNVTLIGNLTKDWEFKTTINGKMVANNTLAVRDGKDKTLFVPIRAWQTTASLLGEYTKKGSKIGIQGRLSIDQFEKDGKNSYYTYITIEEIEFCGGKNNDNN